MGLIQCIKALNKDIYDSTATGQTSLTLYSYNSGNYTTLQEIDLPTGGVYIVNYGLYCTSTVNFKAWFSVSADRNLNNGEYIPRIEYNPTQYNSDPRTAKLPASSVFIIVDSPVKLMLRGISALSNDNISITKYYGTYLSAIKLSD